MITFSYQKEVSLLVVPGGSINLYHVTENGWIYHGNHDVDKIFWEIKEQEKSFNNVIG